MSALPWGRAGKVVSETRHLAKGWGPGASHYVNGQNGKMKSVVILTLNCGEKCSIAVVRVILDGLRK